jgi:hypothetical protein
VCPEQTAAETMMMMMMMMKLCDASSWNRHGLMSD